MIPGGWNMQREASNNQYDPGFVKGTQNEGLFPGGWNSQIETNNKEQYPRPVQSAMKKKEIFLVTDLHLRKVKSALSASLPGEWNSQREAANTNIILDMLKTIWGRTR